MTTQKTEVSTQVVPFNPFAVLNIEQVTAILSKFPKAWKDAHTIELSNAQTEHKCSDAEAIILVWLQSEAQSILNRKQVASIADQIEPLVASVGGTQSAMALDLIATMYNSIDLALRPEVGIRVRDRIQKSMVSAIAETKLKILYEYLKITEKVWMRK